MLNYCKNNKYLILISFLWIILWASLNSFPADIYFIKETFSFQISSKNFLINLINMMRFYLPVIFSNLLIIILIINNLKTNEKNSKFILLCFALFFTQFLGLIFSNFENFNLERTFLLLLSFNGLGIIYLGNIFLNDNQFKKVLFINIFFLILIAILYLPIIYKDFFNSPFLLLYNTRTWNQLYFDDPIIRVTGLSRVLALLTIIFLVRLNEELSKKSLTIILLVLIFLGTNIWGLQSRLVLFTMSIIIFINIIFFSKKRFLKKFFYYSLISALSLLSFKGIQNSKLYYLEKKKPELVERYNYDLKNKKNRIEEVISRTTDKEVDDDELIYITSGRNLIWKKIINSYEYEKIFGYGPQADRYVILKQDKKDINDSGYMTNSSSAFFYSFICGGYFGIIIFIIINFYILKLLYDYLKTRVFNDKNNYSDTLFLLIIFLQIRSVFENSYAVFSLDFLIMTSCVVLLEKIVKFRKNLEN